MSTAQIVILSAVTILDLLVRLYPIYLIKNPEFQARAIFLNFLGFIITTVLLWALVIILSQTKKSCPILEKVENVYRVK